MDDDAIAECGSGIEDSAGVDAAVLADADALADDRACFDAGSGADGCIFADDGSGTDGDLRPEFRMWADHRGWMDPGCGRRGREELGRARKPEARLIGLDEALVLRIRFRAASPQNNRSGIAGQSFDSGRCVLGKCQFRGTGQRGRVHSGKRDFRTSLHQFAAQDFDQFAQLHGFSSVESRLSNRPGLPSPMNP